MPAPVKAVTDLTKAPGMRAKLIGGAEGQVRSYAVIFGEGDGSQLTCGT